MTGDNSTVNEEMLPEYDFSGGVRGKYASRYAECTNFVKLDPDVYKAFPTADAVNEALRSLIKSEKTPPVVTKSKKTAA